MLRTLLATLFATLLLVTWNAGLAPEPTAADNHRISGQGAYRFKVAYKGSHLPPEAQAVLANAHGGFAIDRRPGRGEVYFALPGAGIIQVSSDLSAAKMLPTAAAMKPHNMHNATIWHDSAGGAHLSFPGNDIGAVFTTDLGGKLQHELTAPVGSEDLGPPAATDYFRGRGNFVPTDVEEMGGLLYVATGYSALDYVLTAKIDSTDPFEVSWHDLAFGGKGDSPGQFGTGHGITVPAGMRRIDVADRPHAEIDRFTRHGQYISTLKLPPGSFPCDVDYLDSLAVVGTLHGADRQQGAPIYVLENDRLVSTILPKAELGLENFQHVHNAVLHKANGKLYVIAQAWNPGDFAILERVM
ncbi:MAG: hypothetical protein OXD30_11615 [Bryobacterales bacterium]|nr:hypothetical protein [Bryobacterales bacterium]